MKAYVVDPKCPSGVRFADVPDPKPAAGELVIDVAAFCLNHGELPERENFEPGTIPGWDCAGKVVAAAANGRGPGAGKRVVAYGSGGAWAQLRAVKVANVAEIPQELDWERASTIPTAGVTALQAVRAIGSSLGRRVLVTGASGGVGRLALQIAKLTGAEVVALTSSDANRDELKALGASEVVLKLDALAAPVFGVIEVVGGSTLVDAWNALRSGGILVSVGYASGQPATFAPYDTSLIPRTLLSFRMGNFVLPGQTVAEDCAYLARLMADNKLDPQITWRGPWSKLEEALDRLAHRRISGKAVLRVE